MTSPHAHAARRSAEMFSTAHSLRADAEVLDAAAAATYEGREPEIVILSEPMLDAAISNFLDLCDDGDCRETNPEYYRSGFELIRQTFIRGWADDPTEWLLRRIQNHPQWRGGSSALPL